MRRRNQMFNMHRTGISRLVLALGIVFCLGGTPTALAKKGGKAAKPGTNPAEVTFRDCQGGSA